MIARLVTRNRHRTVCQEEVSNSISTPRRLVIRSDTGMPHRGTGKRITVQKAMSSVEKPDTDISVIA